jgi:hypothetical protein
MDKVIVNGKVAVLYSPGFGSGWYTWNQQFPDPEVFKGGMMDLEIQWIPVGTEFRISEYDGAESIELKDEAGWFTA